MILEVHSYGQHHHVVARSRRPGLYPAVDPLASLSALLDPLIVGAEHYALAERARERLARLKDLQDIISLLGVDELSASYQLVVKRACRLQRFLSQPFVVTEAFTGTPGRRVSRAELWRDAAPSSMARRKIGRKLPSTWSAMAIALTLSRFILVGGLLSLSAFEGAAPLAASSLGLFVGRFFVMRSIATAEK